MNGGTPYSYNLGATCVYDAGSGPEVWISTAANNTTTPGAMGANWNLLISSGRQRLTTNTTFYVATTGNDSNAGTYSSPWLTLQHAVNVLMDSYDLAGFTATMSVATGTYRATRIFWRLPVADRCSFGALVLQFLPIPEMHSMFWLVLLSSLLGFHEIRFRQRYPYFPRWRSIARNRDEFRRMRTCSSAL